MSMFFIEKKEKLLKKRDKIENEISHTQFYKDEDWALARIWIAN